MRNKLLPYSVLAGAISLAQSVQVLASTPQICRFERRAIPFNNVLSMRAVVTPFSGSYGHGVSGRDCYQHFILVVRGKMPDNLLKQMKLSIRTSTRLGYAVVPEADLTFTVTRFSTRVRNLRGRPAGYAHILKASHIAIVKLEPK